MTRTLAQVTVAEVDFPAEVRPVVEQVALVNPDLRPHLACNQGLSEEAWFKLYTAKPIVNVDVAEELVSRRLSKAQIDHVLDVDKRAKVLLSLLGNNELDLAQQRKLLASKGYKEAVGKKFLATSWVDPELARPATFAAKGQVLLTYLANAGTDAISDEEAAELLRTFPEWGPTAERRGSKARSRALKRLLARRPQLLPVAVAAGQDRSVVTTAGGSPYLRDEALQRTALETASAWITPAATYDYDSTEGVDFTLMALANNPYTTPAVVADILALADKNNRYKLGNSARNRKTRRPYAITVAYDEVSHPEELHWLVNRALPRETADFNQAGKPIDIAALAGNPNLTEEQANGIAAALTSDEEVLYTLGEELVRTARVTFANLYPDHTPESWESDQTSYDVLEAPSDWQDYLNTVREVDYDDAMKIGVKEIPYRGAEAPYLTHASSRLGTERAHWEMFFTLVNEFEGSFDLLLLTCTLV